MAHTHADGTHQEKVSSAELFDQVETGEGGNDIYTVGNDLNSEGILETSALEVLCAIVNCVEREGVLESG